MSKPKISEAEFTKQVLHLARLRGWRTAHFRPGMTQSGNWVTAVQGDGKGFPDLILIRDGEILAIELKVGNNRTTPEQDAWLSAFGSAGASVGVWRPEDWDYIKSTLERQQ